MVLRSTLEARTTPLRSRIWPRSAGWTSVTTRLSNAASWTLAASNACTRSSCAANTVKTNIAADEHERARGGAGSPRVRRGDAGPPDWTASARRPAPRGGRLVGAPAAGADRSAAAGAGRPVSARHRFTRHGVGFGRRGGGRRGCRGAAAGSGRGRRGGAGGGATGVVTMLRRWSSLAGWATPMIEPSESRTNAMLLAGTMPSCWARSARLRGERRSSTTWVSCSCWSVASRTWPEGFSAGRCPDARAVFIISRATQAGREQGMQMTANTPPPVRRIAAAPPAAGRAGRHAAYPVGGSRREGRAAVSAGSGSSPPSPRRGRSSRTRSAARSRAEAARGFSATSLGLGSSAPRVSRRRYAACSGSSTGRPGGVLDCAPPR